MMAPGLVENAVETNESPKPDSGILKAEEAKQARWTPQTVLSTMRPQPQTQSSSPVPFFHLLERLKTTKREGWRRFGISHGESIGDHMYRMSILTMLCPAELSRRLNVPHCTKMALVHDMAEALVGDITPVDGVVKSEKSRRETETMEYICKGLLGNVGGGLAGEDIRKVWQEYEDNETLEAKFVHDVDKMELLLQMLEYERSHEGRIDLSEFSWVAQRIELPEVKEWCDQVLKDRDEYWNEIGKSPHHSPLKGKTQE
ncbi:hypothetical protein K461DRAFT_245243 [Myriangium duriaei CBS 260.36]|uniref:5'-deoxynucleotidase n=1 Tax=Myriangium duriaei CBS 260.36 TaxID=1168546 RepID=A0A9P4MDH8_9PEZI|nr:hypothetical protein K461DRAFT_245243 [Myriangium duriaei CBS 260.36]